ncbi:MAG: hypothetical protein M1838_002794 [Thelocarpon superellum]|nr:MAG: hypothetical protein M1838_002794 [Thelocarpon superellum]
MRDGFPDPPSHLLSSLTIGFNHTIRHLQALSEQSRPVTLRRRPDLPNTTAPALRPLAAIFVVPSAQTTLMQASLPLMAATASRAHPDRKPTQVVMLPRTAGNGLAAAIALPSVSMIGIMHDADQAQGLLDYVKEHVPVTSLPWMDELAAAEYRPAQIKAVQITAPVVVKKRNQSGPYTGAGRKV